MKLSSNFAEVRRPNRPCEGTEDAPALSGAPPKRQDLGTGMGPNIMGSPNHPRVFP